MSQHGANDQQIGIAVIGASGHAARVAVPTIERAAGARLAGVLGGSAQSGPRLAAAHPGARGYADFSELAVDPGVDAVWIAGPNHLHSALAEQCLRAGKHVLVEKPLAVRAADAERIATVAASQGLVAGVDFQHRFRGGHLWLHRQLRAGLVGTPRLIRIHRFWPYPYYPDMPADISGSWRASVEGSGGWALNDIGSHLVDLALWLIGQDARLAFARTANHRFTEVGAEDTAVLIADAADGATIVIETSNAMPSFPGTVEVHGTGGWLRADGTFDEEGEVLVHDGTRHSFRSSAEAVYSASLDDFVERVNGRPAVGATAAEAVVTTRIVETAAAAHRAARTAEPDASEAAASDQKSS